MSIKREVKTMSSILEARIVFEIEKTIKKRIFKIVVFWIYNFRKSFLEL